MTSQTRLPEPETKSGLLRSAGYKAFTLTRHRFAETKLAGDCYQFWYACDETGVRRLWGTRSLFD